MYDLLPQPPDEPLGHLREEGRAAQLTGGALIKIYIYIYIYVYNNNNSNSNTIISYHDV